MYQRWFYTHEGQTHGQVSPAEARQLLASGQLPPHVLLGPEVPDPQAIVEALTAVELATAGAAPAVAPPTSPGGPLPAAPSPAVSHAAPSWLADVQKRESTA